MNWRCVVGAATAVSVCLAQPLIAQRSVSETDAPAGPLKVTSVTTDDRGALTIQLTNTGSEVVTGWVIGVSDSSQLVQRSKRDCYTSFITEPQCLKPGESTEARIVLPSSDGLAPPSATVLATILDHGRVIGSREEAAEILDARARARVAIEHLVRTFSTSLTDEQSAIPSASLAQAVQSAAVKDQNRALNAVATGTTRLTAEASEADKASSLGFRLVQRIGELASQLENGEMPGFSRVDFANFLQRAQAVHVQHAPNGGVQ